MSVTRVRSAIGAFAVLLFGASAALAQDIEFPWGETREVIISGPLEFRDYSGPGQQGAEHYYPIYREIIFDSGHGFTALYGFDISDDTLVRVFMSLVEGTPSTLFDALVAEFGGGEELIPLSVLEDTATIVHRQRWRAPNMTVVYDRKGEQVSLIYLPR